MVITTERIEQSESETPADAVNTTVKEEAVARGADQAGRSIEVATIREASRLAALQTELRLLGDLASMDEFVLPALGRIQRIGG